MKLELIFAYSDLTERDMKDLRIGNVDLDDWDYMIICPKKAVESVFYEDEKECRIQPKAYTLERLLRGCADNKWYIIKFRGHTQAVGIAYHA